MVSPSTVGPSVPRRVNSNTVAKTTGESSIAQRERRTRPATMPTMSAMAMVPSDSRLVRGPRGIHQPATRPHIPLTATTTPVNASARNGTGDRAGSFPDFPCHACCLVQGICASLTADSTRSTYLGCCPGRDAGKGPKPLPAQRGTAKTEARTGL